MHGKIGVTEPWLKPGIPSKATHAPDIWLRDALNFDSATVATRSVRSKVPPVIGSPAFQKDMNELLDIAKNQTRVSRRALPASGSDGVGSYTPPGHWHRKGAALCHEKQYSEVRTARTLALLGTTLQDAGISCWDVKYYYYYLRPNQMNSKIKNIFGLCRNFPSYTSGHSTFSGAAAEILAHIFPDKKKEVNDMASEASGFRAFTGPHPLLFRLRSWAFVRT